MNTRQTEEKKGVVVHDYKRLPVFNHHIYEYSRGLRRLILHTADRDDGPAMKARLLARHIPFLIYDVNDRYINVFFGEPECIEVLRSIGKEKLSDFSDEEDFILGMMLGYGMEQQCRRYLQRKGHEQELPDLIG